MDGFSLVSYDEYQMLQFISIVTSVDLIAGADFVHSQRDVHFG